jgi:uncharacterized protein YoxC
MEWLKKLDIKSIAIIVLGIALIISFLFGQHNNVDLKKDVIEQLHKENEAIAKRNDSLLQANKRIDQEIQDIHNRLAETAMELVSTQKQLKDLKNKTNEIPKYVGTLSANGVASEFTKYLNTKSTNSH